MGRYRELDNKECRSYWVQLHKTNPCEKIETSSTINICRDMRPVQSARKFSAVFGATSVKSCNNEQYVRCTLVLLV